MSRWFRGPIALSILALLSTGFAPGDPPKGDPSTADLRTVETAISAPITKAGAPTGTEPAPAYLGILLGPGPDVVIADVDPDSPASKAGVLPGDVVRKLDGRVVNDGDALAEILGEKSSGETLDIELARQDKPVSVRAILTPWSRSRRRQVDPGPASAWRSPRSRRPRA